MMYQKFYLILYVNMACDISNKMLAEIISSPNLLKKVKKDIDLIKDYNIRIKAIEEWKNPNINVVSRLKQAQKVSESNIIYISTFKSISEWLKNRWLFNDEIFNGLVKSLKKVFPEEYWQYLDNLDNVNLWSSLVWKKVNADDVAHIVSFDMAIRHKFDWFKAPTETELLAKSHYKISDSTYMIYRNMMNDIVSNKDINTNDISKIVEWLKKWWTDLSILRDVEDLQNLIKSSTTLRELEESFLLWLNVLDDTTLGLFLSKMDDLRFWKGWIQKSFWESLWTPIYNPWKVIKNWMKEDVLKRFRAASSLFDSQELKFVEWIEKNKKWEIIKRNIDEVVNRVVDLLRGKVKKINLWWEKIYTIADKDLLMKIVWDDLIEAKFFEEWVFSYKLADLKWMSNATDDIVVKPDVKFDTPLHQEARKYKSAEEFVKDNIFVKEKNGFRTRIKNDKWYADYYIDDYDWWKELIIDMIETKETWKWYWDRIMQELENIAIDKKVDRISLHAYEQWNVPTDKLVNFYEKHWYTIEAGSDWMWYEMIKEYDNLNYWKVKNLNKSQLKQIREEANKVIKPDEWIDVWITSVKWFERQDVDKIVNQAKKLEKEWKYQEAQKLFDESIEEWKNVLKNAFWDKILRLWNWIWRREWKSEPTIIFWLKNITENDIDILVDISQNKFKQKSFFTAEYSDIEKFWIINEKEWLSIEPWAIIYTKNKITLENAKEIDKMFEKNWIYAWTILPNGEWIKLYNLSAFNTNYEWFYKSIRKFAKDLEMSDTFWVQGISKWTSFRIRHIWTSRKQWLWTYRWWKSIRWDKYLSDQSLRVNLEKQLDDVLTDTPNYWNSILKFVNKDWKTAPVGQHYFVDVNIYDAPTAEWYIDIYKVLWEDNSFNIGMPLERISTTKEEFANVIKWLVEKWTKENPINIMLRDDRAMKYLYDFPIWDLDAVRFTYPRDKGSYFYMDWTDVKLWVIHDTIKKDIISSFNKIWVDLWVDSKFIERDWLDIVAIRQQYWFDTTVEKVADIFETDKTAISSVKDLLSVSKTISQTDWRLVSIWVDYGAEWKNVLLKDKDFFISEAKYLAPDQNLITDWLDLSRLQNDWYNWAFAKNLTDKEYARKIFLKNFDVTIWDIYLNTRKQIELQMELRKNYEINMDWFKDFVDLLSRNNVSDGDILENTFILNTVTKNSIDRPESQEFIKFFNDSRNLVDSIDKRISWTTENISDSIKKKIQLPKEWKWIAIVENDVSLIWLRWQQIEDAWKYPDFKYWEEIDDYLTVEQKRREAVMQWTDFTEDFVSFSDVSKMFSNETDKLFDNYIDYVTRLVEEWWPDLDKKLWKLYSSFDYALIKLESDMQYSFKLATSKWWELKWFHYSIWAYRQAEDIQKYIENLTTQKDIIKRRLNGVVDNIVEANRNDGILFNGNVINWQIIQDWKDYAKWLARKVWETYPEDYFKNISSRELKEFISLKKQQFEELNKTKWTIHTIYNAISDGIRTSNFLDEYKLVDDIVSWMKIPQKFIDINPSVFSNWKALSMDVSHKILVDMFRWVSDMYKPTWYKLWDKILQMTWSPKENLRQMKELVSNIIDDVISKMDDTSNINPKWLKEAYTSMIAPYSDFVKIPQKSIDSVVEKYKFWSADVDSFMKQYIWEQPIEIKTDIFPYSKEYLQKTNDVAENIADYVNKTFDDSFSEILKWWATELFMDSVRSILTNDWREWRWLRQLYDANRANWKKVSNELDRILPRDLTWWLDFSKWKMWKSFYFFDKELLYKAQDALKEMLDAWLRWEKLSAFVARKWTADYQIAESLVNYFEKYREILWNIIPRLDNNQVDVFNKLYDTFLRIGRDENYNKAVLVNNDELVKSRSWKKAKEYISSEKEMKQQLNALAKMAENNNFLWVFNLSNWPDTILKKMNFKTYIDWRIVFDGNIENASTWANEFNKFFWTNLSEDQYLYIYEAVFWWRLAQFANWIDSTSWFIKQIWRTVFNPLIRAPVVAWINIMSWITTWILPWLWRGKQLIAWISDPDKNAIVRIMTDFWLVDEYFDLSASWVKQLYWEALRMWWGSISKWLMRSFKSGSLKNSFNLVTTNTNNVLDIMLMGNYKLYSVYNAMQWLSWRRFSSAVEFEKYLRWLDESSRANVLTELQALSNRWFYSIIAATDGNFDKSLSSLKMLTRTSKALTWSDMTWRQLASIFKWIQQNISFLNGWWDGIVRWFARWVLNSVDVGKYLIKNWFKWEALDNVVKFYQSTPEFHQFVHTMVADIMLLARWIRIQRSYEDIYEDWEWISLDDVVDAVSIFTTIWNWYWSSLFWQTIWRATEIANIEMKKNVEDNIKFWYWAVWWNALTSTIMRRFFVDLKYLKPRNFMMAQMQKTEWTLTEKIAAWLQTLVATAGSWMIRFMLEDSFDPNNLKYTLDDRWIIPEVMWTDVSDDTKQAYNQSVVDLVTAAKLWDWSSYVRWLLNNNMVSWNIIRPLKKLLAWQFRTQSEVAEIAWQFEVFNDFFNWRNIKVWISDYDSIRTDVFNRALTNYNTIEQWLGDWQINYWNAYFDDAIWIIYDKIWKEWMQNIYNYLTSFRKNKDKDMSELDVLSIFKSYVENNDMWEVEDLAKAVINHTALSLNVHNSIPDWPEINKVNHFLNSFDLYYQWMLENNVEMMTDFVIKKHNRETPETALPIYDKNWKFKSQYRDYIRDERLLKDAIDKWDIDFINARFNPLVKSQKFTAWKLMNKDWTINETALFSLNRSMNYIKSTAWNRPQWQTAEMLWAIVQADIENFVDLYRKDIEMYWWMSEWLKNYVDNVFYTEWVMTDYIEDLQNWYDIVKWWDGNGGKVWKLSADFEKIASAFDKIRDDFKQQVNLPKFKQTSFALNGSEKTLFKPKKIESYSPQYSKSIYEDNISEEKPKDIKRKIKPSKDFKFKE